MNAPESSPEPSPDPVFAALTVATFAMVSLAGVRGADTSNHILRIQHYVRVLAQRLQKHPRFSAALTDAYIEHLFQSAPLYDIGTMGIPDRILLKPSSLTTDEFEIMKTHTTMARDAIENAEKALGFKADLLQTAKELVYSHQEKWDGSGYPQGLSGEQIPLSARLLAIADVYDALISDRVYRVGVTHAKAVIVIFEGRDRHFDPDMVDVFVEIQDDFKAVAQRFPDTAQDMQTKIEYMVNALAENADM